MVQSWRLSQLTEQIREVLQQGLARQRFWVVAEVSNHQFYVQKGFHYFDLIETAETGYGRGSILAKMPAVAWKEGAGAIRSFERETGQRFGDSVQVLAEVSVDFHPVYGLKLTLLQLDARFTIGMLELQKKRTMEQLIRQFPSFVWEEGGLLKSFNQELELPPVLQRIAVVSSKTAAGMEDFLHTLENNGESYHYEIHPFYATVQGEQHAAAFAAVISSIADRALELKKDFDAVVIIRGGGAATDLLLFDQLDVAVAVASCPFPVLTGIGHQKNETLADLLAFQAFKTPTQVAEFLIGHNRAFELKVLEAGRSIKVLAQQLVGQTTFLLKEASTDISLRSRELLHFQRQRLLEAGMVVRKSPAFLLQQQHARVRNLQLQLTNAGSQLIKHKQQDLEHLLRLFRMASPYSVWRRGFAVVQSDGQWVADAAALEPGNTFKLYIKGAEIEALITQKTAFDGDPFNL